MGALPVVAILSAIYAITEKLPSSKRRVCFTEFLPLDPTVAFQESSLSFDMFHQFILAACVSVLAYGAPSVMPDGAQAASTRANNTGTHCVRRLSLQRISY